MVPTVVSPLWVEDSLSNQRREREGPYAIARPKECLLVPSKTPRSGSGTSSCRASCRRRNSVCESGLETTRSSFPPFPSSQAPSGLGGPAAPARLLGHGRGDPEQLAEDAAGDRGGDGQDHALSALHAQQGRGPRAAGPREDLARPAAGDPRPDPAGRAPPGPQGRGALYAGPGDAGRRRHAAGHAWAGRGGRGHARRAASGLLLVGRRFPGHAPALSAGGAQRRGAPGALAQPRLLQRRLLRRARQRARAAARGAASARAVRVPLCHAGSTAQRGREDPSCDGRCRLRA